MPLIDEEPPSTRPRGQSMRRPSRCVSGSDSNPQLNADRFIGIDSAVGMRTKRFRSEPPASRRATVTSGSSDNRAARMQPAEPAPTTM